VSEEVLMFGGLEVQSEINRLLDELYDNLDRATLDEAGGPRVGHAPRQGDELAWKARDKKVCKEQ
jgi:hypothetical protein